MGTFDDIKGILDEQDAHIARLNENVDMLSALVKSANEKADKAEKDSLAVSQRADEAIKRASLPKQRIFMNTHLFSDPSYSDTDRVVRLLNDIGIKYIRQDFDVDASGKMLQHDNYINVIQPLFLEAGIHIRPMLYSRGLKLNGNPQENYAIGQALTQSFLKLYQFDEIELGNELALKSLLPGTQGDQAKHYNPAALDNTVDFVQGMYRASLATNVKVIINTEWLHQYYIDALRAVGVNAFISLHGYTDIYGNAAKIKGMPLIDFLNNKYGAMFTEIGETNYMPPSDGSFDEQLQVDKFIPLFKQLLAKGKDIGLFELLDRVNSKGREGNLGFYKSDGTAKLIVGEIKKIINPVSF